jgi:hypothetical protein
VATPQAAQVLQELAQRTLEDTPQARLLAPFLEPARPRGG